MRRLFIFIFMLCPLIVLAQDSDDQSLVYEMTTENNVFVGARAAGMGGAQIAAGDDGSAVWYNPALLTRIQRIEISGGLSYQKFYNHTTFNGVTSEEEHITNTRFSSLWGVFPVPTEQGALSLAVAVNRVKNFDRLFRFESESDWWDNHYFDDYTTEGYGGGEDDLGGLWAYSFGGGIEISRYVSLGASLELYDGSDDYTYVLDEIYESESYSYSSELDNDYSGYSGKVGLAYSPNSNLHFGATIKLPAYLTVKQEYTEDGGYPDYAEYKYTTPFSFGFGTMYALQNLLLAADLNYTDYTELDYRSGVDNAEALLVRDAYKSVVGINVGAEYLFPELGLSLRAGYSRDPIPFTYYPVTNDLDVYTAGFGYLLDKTLKFDMAFNYLKWSREDRNYLDVGDQEYYKTYRLYVGLTYRM